MPEGTNVPTPYGFANISASLQFIDLLPPYRGDTRRQRCVCATRLQRVGCGTRCCMFEAALCIKAIEKRVDAAARHQRFSNRSKMESTSRNRLHARSAVDMTHRFAKFETVERECGCRCAALSATRDVRILSSGHRETSICSDAKNSLNTRYARATFTLI
jgi:hypothetical protein